VAELKIIEDTDELTHVALSGRLDLAGVHDVELEFTAKTASRKRPTLVDLSQVEFLASLGMGMLVSVQRSLAAYKARLVLMAPSELVEQSLTAASLDKLIPIARDREHALELLSSR
jgi:anti-anti-sigma factor